MTNIPSQVKVARAATEWLRDELSTLTPEHWQAPAKLTEEVPVIPALCAAS